MRLTLDNNCIVAVENGEPASQAVRGLSQANRKGRDVVAVLGISASERQRGGAYPTSIVEFRSQLEKLGLSEREIYKPTSIWDVTYWDWSEFASSEDVALERRIHDAMFPPDDFDWCSVAASSGEAIESKDGPGYRRWRNRRCDVQGMLAHIRHGGDVFVTRDSHFLRNASALCVLGAGSIKNQADLLSDLE